MQIKTTMRYHLTPVRKAIIKQSIINLQIINASESVMEKKMATNSSILAWRISGMEEPGGLLSVGSHRVRHD